MSAPTDYLLDRRRMRRKLGWWRMAAIAAGGLALLIAVSKLSGADSTDKLTPHIARLSIQGMITGDKDTLDLIKKVGESSQAKALLLTIDSPGGTTTGAEFGAEVSGEAQLQGEGNTQNPGGAGVNGSGSANVEGSVEVAPELPDVVPGGDD